LNGSGIGGEIQERNVAEQEGLVVFIRLVLSDGVGVVVNASHIIYVHRHPSSPQDSGAVVTLTGGRSLYVRETVDEIAELLRDAVPPARSEPPPRLSA
jgi:uncharacterized protein YlzI (FlbEa/FlbD family)